MKNKVVEIRTGLISNNKKALKIVSKKFRYRVSNSAPRGDTGKLKRGIRRRAVKGGWRVSSMVNKSFPYHMWVDGQPKYRSIKPRWSNGSKIVYGKPFTTKSGNQVRWTGENRYFSKHIPWARRELIKEAKKQTEKSLKK